MLKPPVRTFATTDYCPVDTLVRRDMPHSLVGGSFLCGMPSHKAAGIIELELESKFKSELLSLLFGFREHC